MSLPREPGLAICAIRIREDGPITTLFDFTDWSTIHFSLSFGRQEIWRLLRRSPTNYTTAELSRVQLPQSVVAEELEVAVEHEAVAAMGMGGFTAEVLGIDRLIFGVIDVNDQLDVSGVVRVQGHDERIT